MKKSILTILLFVFALTFKSYSQDIIYKTDGSKEEVKITLVGEKEIQYKKFSNQAGPVYTLAKKDILLITYENGEYETISKFESTEQPVKPDLRKDFARNIFSHDLFELVFMNFTVSYERLLSNGIVGFKIPLSVCFDRYNNSNFNFNNIFYSGFGLNFYPTGQGKWRYFVGPQVRVGYGWETNWMTYFDDYGNYLYDEEIENEGLYTKFFVDNGVMFTPIKNFSFSIVGSIGIRYFPEASNDYDSVRPDGDFSINISYRF